MIAIPIKLDLFANKTNPYSQRIYMTNIGNKNTAKITVYDKRIYFTTSNSEIMERGVQIASNLYTVIHYKQRLFISIYSNVAYVHHVGNIKEA